MDDEHEVWILGATGRSGRSVADELVARGIRPTLVGRYAGRLAAAAAGHGLPTLIAATKADMAALIRAERPAAVVHTAGPFTVADGIALACVAAGAHYVDLANDIGAVLGLLDLGRAAEVAGATLVTGAGFGVTATESVVVALCAGRPTPEHVRVDMVPSLATEAGRLGDALAGSILDGLPGVPGGGRFEGRRYWDGRLVGDRMGGRAERIVLPEGGTVTTGSIPLGELVAAQRASGAPSVVSASTAVPDAAPIRAAMPAALALLGIRPLRDLAKRRLAGVEMKAAPRPRAYSWGHARVRWADGTVREGWLRLGDAQDFTGSVPAEVVARLLRGEGRPGAFTPAALFGTSLAQACGGTYLQDAAAQASGTTP